MASYLSNLAQWPVLPHDRGIWNRKALRFVLDSWPELFVSSLGTFSRN